MTPREPDGLVWRKSTFSGGNGDCIEVAPVATGVLVRDSKNAAGHTLAVPRTHWRTFLTTVHPTR